MSDPELSHSILPPFSIPPFGSVEHEMEERRNEELKRENGLSKERTVLSIEISTPHGQVAVVRGDDVLYSAEFASQRSHNAQLFSPLREALAAAGDALDLIVVGTGPGSYTGVRIAIAAAQGISLSRGAPVVGLPSILVPEAANGTTSFCIVGDARRDSYYTARIENGSLRDGIQLLPYAELSAWLHQQATLPIFTFEPRVAEIDGIRFTTPSAIQLAHMSARLSPTDITSQTAAPIEPIYLRDAFITTPKRSWLQVQESDARGRV
jgi:tRNA threonylcarbamoyladenosine biosynthesis protein TsaB